MSTPFSSVMKSQDAAARLKNLVRTTTCLRESFDQLHERAGEIAANTDPRSGIAGLIELEAPYAAGVAQFTVQVFGRRVRVWLDFDYANEKGIVVVDDVTRPEPSSPIRVGQFTFEPNSITDVPGGYAPGSNCQLVEPADTWTLVLNIVEKALRVKLSDHQP